MDIVYPLKRSAWDKEILFSLRSLDRHFMGPCRVHICGDYKPDWIRGIEYHPFTFSADKHTDANIAPVLEWACIQFNDFVWMADDVYFLKDTAVSDLLPHPHIGILNQVRVRGTRPWQNRLWATFDMLESAGITPVYNHATHTPGFYNADKMIACAKDFPVFAGEALIATIYYNIYGPKEPPKLTEKAGFYRKGVPVNFADPHYRFLNHDDKGLSEELKQAIKNRFNKKSIYER